MLDIADINATIAKLENSETNLANCSKLAALYTVREHYKSNKKEVKENDKQIGVQKEYTDILPIYCQYCDVKRKYQLHEVTAEAVNQAIKDVCIEIKEFIQTLYSTTDMPEEREAIKKMLANLQNL